MDNKLAAKWSKYHTVTTITAKQPHRVFAIKLESTTNIMIGKDSSQLEVFPVLDFGQQKSCSTTVSNAIILTVN